MGASSTQAARVLFVIPGLALIAALCGSPHPREWALGDVSAETMGRGVKEAGRSRRKKNRLPYY